MIDVDCMTYTSPINHLLETLRFLVLTPVLPVPVTGSRRQNRLKFSNQATPLLHTTNCRINPIPAF